MKSVTFFMNFLSKYNDFSSKKSIETADQILYEFLKSILNAWLRSNSDGDHEVIGSPYSPIMF